MEKMVMDLCFWKDKRVFLTGHTGFKGAWLSRMLTLAGADLTGYALAADKDSLFSLCHLADNMTSIIGDIRDSNALACAFEKSHPEIVIHMAAQPLVMESYERPAYTYETNIMGTVNILECVRKSKDVKSFLNVTTDKVYQNNEWEWGYRESDLLDGFDPYSNSKSCSDLITFAYQRSFFNEKDTAISTARAGNVIGGGDFAADRIIPDCVRAAANGQPVLLRNPNSVRPYQHVLEPLWAYLMIAQGQYETPECATCYNVGPCDTDCVSTRELVSLFCNLWGNDLKWECSDFSAVAPHEANFLRLDCSRLKNVFGWKPRWDICMTMKKTVEWYKAFIAKGDILGVMDRQIQEFVRVE